MKALSSRFPRSSALTPTLIALAISCWCFAAGAAPYPVGGLQDGEFGRGGDEKLGLSPTEVPGGGPPIPAAFALRLVSENPGGGSSVFEFDVPGRTWVSIEVFDVLGRNVGTPLRDRPYDPGTYRAPIAPQWLASGEFFCRFTARDPETGLASFRETHKLLVVR